MIDAAVRHLAAVAPTERPLVLYVSVAGGEASEALVQRLRDALVARLQVQFAQATLGAGPPLPGGAPGAHVQSVRTSVTPWPDRVVRVQVLGSAQTIAVRQPGSDPLGPAVAGWEWFETRP